MNNNIDEYIFMNSHNSIKNNILSLGLFISLAVFIYIIFNYNYIIYDDVVGIYNNQKLSLIVEIDNVKHVINENQFIIEDKKYNYNVDRIDEGLILENNKNYKKIDLNISLPKKMRVDNYIVTVKIKKDNKKIFKYILDYF